MYRSIPHSHASSTRSSCSATAFPVLQPCSPHSTRPATTRPCSQPMLQQTHRLRCPGQTHRLPLLSPQVCHAVRPKSGRSSSRGVTQDKPEDRVFRLDIDYLTFLGLDSKRKYKESEILFSYDRLLNAPLDPGYSAEVAVGRKVLLDVAKEVALEQQERPYGESEMIDVPQKLMPSALAVLAEVGLYVVVLELGHKLLDDWDVRKDHKRDILLALALASCGRATELLTKQAKISLAYEQMEAALGYIEDAGFPPLAPGLAADVQQGLDNLKPQYILECLAAPAGGMVANPDAETITRRRTAIRLLRTLAQTPDQKLPSMVPSISPDYMHQVLRELTATEVMQLANWQAVSVTPPTWCDLAVLQAAAAAHILAGLQQGRPALVKTASVVLHSAHERYSKTPVLPSSKEAPHSTPTAELLVEGAVCEFLLGDVDTSLRLLREACAAGASSSSPAPNPPSITPNRAQMPRAPQALAFVEHWSRTVGAAEGDLLPGLCILTECWIAQVAIPGFQAAASSPPAAKQLLKYFEGIQLESMIVLYDNHTPALPQTLKKTLASIRSTLQQRASPADGAAPAAAAAPRETKSAKAGGVDVLTGLVGGLLVLAAGSTFAFSTHSGRQLLDSAFPAASASLYDWEQATQLEQLSIWDRALSNPQLDTEAAIALVHKWQALKAVSMGPQHAGDLLSGALAQPLLGHYQKKVQKFEEQGLYMRYKLWSVQIDEIDTSSLTANGGFGVVVTTLNESAVLHAEDGTAADSYHSIYNAVYKVVRSESGSWRIQDVKVVPRD